MALTDEGYIKRTPDELKDAIKRDFEINGAAFLELPADIQNNLIDTAIPVLMQFENISAEIANSYGPDYANDFIWKNLASSLGLTRNSEVKAQVELKFTGNPGVYIPMDLEVGAFKTSKAVTLDSTGQALVLAYSDADVFVEANELTEISEVVDPSLKVTNPEASIRELPIEPISNLRDRARTILRSARKGSIGYATALLKGLRGVNPQLVKFRFLDYNYEVMVDDIKVLKNVRGIEAIIGGGDANEVAGALFESFLETPKLISQPSNNEVDRTINVQLNHFGSVVPIQFTRPKNISLSIKIILAFSEIAVSPMSAEGILKNPITNFINGRQLGEKLNKNTLDVIVFNEFQKKGIKPVNLASIRYEIMSEGKRLEFNSQGFLDEVKWDCYLTLSGFVIEVTAN